MKSLKIHSLDKGWCDRDVLLLHAAFQILVDYVEQEKPREVVDWSVDAKHRQAWKEIVSLYRWWTKTRPARRSPLDDKRLKKPPFRWRDVPGTNCRELLDWDKKKYAKYEDALRRHTRLEQKWQEEDQTNLCRLINIRPFLWT